MQTTVPKTEIFEIPSLRLATEGFNLELIDRLFQEGKIDGHTRNWLCLAVQEAITNSLEHGNLELQSSWKEEIEADGQDRFSREKKDRLMKSEYANRRVIISVAYDELHVAIEVTDEGNGLKAIPEEELPNDNAFGKGFALMRAGVDQINFNRLGNGIRLVKWF